MLRYTDKCYLEESKDWCFEMYLNHRALREADRVRKQLMSILKRLEVPMVSASSDRTKAAKSDYYMNVRKALVEGFFFQVALK